MDKARSVNLEMSNQNSGNGSNNNPNRPASPSRHDNWKMFDRIANRYDLLNHLLSANIDKRWRRQVARLLPKGDNLSTLDLACGTGDQLLTLHESGRVTEGIGIDLAEKMLAVGREKISRLNLDGKLSLQTGDAGLIPFEDERFDAVTISFGIRNMIDVQQTLREMYRVLKPGGRALILEFSLPSNHFFRSLYIFYLRHILPRLGAIISGDSSAYRYLNETIETFPHGDDFCRLMTDADFASIIAKPLSLGIATIYRGDRT